MHSSFGLATLGLRMTMDILSGSCFGNSFQLVYSFQHQFVRHIAGDLDSV